MKLEGKVAIVTGAGGGIGYATARRFLQEGARVVLADISEIGRRRTQELQAEGFPAEFCLTDVSNLGDVQDLVEKTLGRFGRIDILVNNAAINIPGSILELTEKQWDASFDVNVKSMFLLSREVIPAMRQVGGGSIINMASGNSFVAEPRLSAYVATKGAILMLTKAMALDFAPENIRVNCICPGWVDTAFNDAHADLYGGREEILKSVAEFQPLGRTIRPDEVASTALFLASDDSSAFIGAELKVDGGYTAR